MPQVEDEMGPWRMDPGTELSQSEFTLMRYLISGTPLDGALDTMGISFESGGHMSRGMLGKALLLTRSHIAQMDVAQQALRKKYEAFLDSLRLHLPADELIKNHDGSINKEDEGGRGDI